LDWEWDRLVHWIDEPKLDYDQCSRNRGGDFYSLTGRRRGASQLILPLLSAVSIRRVWL